MEENADDPGAAPMEGSPSLRAMAAFALALPGLLLTIAAARWR